MKTESEMFSVMANYCAQTERCLFDVRKKIRAENFSRDEEKCIIDRLVSEKYIDEKRFSCSFVHDKFHLNRWGRIKITYELKLRGIPSEIFYEAIETINEDEYLTALAELLKNKKRLVKGRSTQDIYQKLSRFAATRGFEPELINRTIKRMFKNMDDDEYVE